MTEASQNNKWLAFIKKHKCLILFFILTWKIWMILLLHTIIMPVRCYMWEGKEVEVFLTPEEWRALSGISESLKNIEWVYYPTIEGEPEKDLFFIKNQGVYQPVMYFNGNKHYLDGVNSKYPHLNLYKYINPTTVFGHNTFILYDHNLRKVILQYHLIAGYFRSPLSGLADSVKCNNNDFSDGYTLIKNYLNN